MVKISYCKFAWDIPGTLSFNVSLVWTVWKLMTFIAPGTDVWSVRDTGVNYLFSS